MEKRGSIFSTDDFLSLKQARADLSGEGEYRIEHADVPTNSLVSDNYTQEYIETSWNSPKAPRISRTPTRGILLPAPPPFIPDALKMSTARRPSHITELPLNTHNLYPGHRFECQVVRKMLREELERIKFSRVDESMCLNLSNQVKKRVKNLEFSRYKYIVIVSVCEDKGQSVNMSTQCFWDGKEDTFVTETIEVKDSLHVVCTVYAVYHS